MQRWWDCAFAARKWQSNDADTTCAESEYEWGSSFCVADYNFIIRLFYHQACWLEKISNVSMCLFLSFAVLSVIEKIRFVVTEQKVQATSFDLLEAINANGLLYFLLANLLTGAVNLSTVTMSASSSLALTELTVYVVSLSATVSALHVHAIRLKFWWHLHWYQYIWRRDII